jgi:hypothetical protein
MSKPYYDIDNNDGGWLGRYTTGLTGATDVVLTPAVVTDIENSVDSMIEGALGERFSSGTTPPIIKMIAGILTASQVGQRANQGRNADQTVIALGLEERATKMLNDIMCSKIKIYSTSGAETVITSKEGESVRMGDVEDQHVFDPGHQPEDWNTRETVYSE